MREQWWHRPPCVCGLVAEITAPVNARATGSGQGSPLRSRRWRCGAELGESWGRASGQQQGSEQYQRRLCPPVHL